MRPAEIVVVIGTRPEAVKLAPVVLALREAEWCRVRVLATAQHRELLDQILSFFGIHADVDLDLMRPGQTLADLTGRMVGTLDHALADISPDFVFAQGDTTTVLVTALCCFYRDIRFGHVEAGLRTHLKRDRARHKVFQVSGLGLVEMSRQRVRPSLLSQLSDDCPFCTGTGKVLSMETMSNRIERLIHRIFSATREKRLQIQANPTLALYLLEERGEQFRELCRSLDLEINVLDDPVLHVEEFRIISLSTDRDLIAEFEKKTRRRKRSARRSS